MPTTNLTGQKILNSTIVDFYNRLNALRHLSYAPPTSATLTPGTTNVSFSAPGVSTLIYPTTLEQVEEEIRATKAALPFLATVDIDTYTPASVDRGELIEAMETAHPVEWQIGQLENACFTNFTENRITVRVTNFLNNAPGLTTNNITQRTNNFAAQFSGHVTTTFTNHFATQFGADFAGNYTANCGTVYTTQRGANHTANFGNVKSSNLATQATFRTVHSSKRVSNSSNFSTGAPFTYMTFNWAQGGGRADQRTSNNKGNNSAGTSTKSTNKASQNTSKRGANHGTFCVTVYTAQFAAQYGANFGTVFTTQRGVNHTAQRGANHTSVVGHTCPTYFGNDNASFCATVNGSQFTTFCATVCTLNDASNWSNFTATYFANKSSFTVNPLSDV